MPEHLRALFAVIFLSLPAFFLARSLGRTVLPKRELRYWQIGWVLLTAAAFLLPSFFMFILVAAGVFAFSHVVRLFAPATWFALLVSVPLVGVVFGFSGVMNNIIELNIARLLTVFLLIPALLKNKGHNDRDSTYIWPDRLIVMYFALTASLAFRDANLTSGLRGATQSALDIVLPYFAFSRLPQTFSDVRRVLFGFVFAALPLAFIAIFEMLKAWPLYDSISISWGSPLGYVSRSGWLRASGTAGPIPLGIIFMVAIGCMLAILPSVPKSRYSIAVLSVFLLGSIATLSRGPWVGLAVLIAVYLATASLNTVKVGAFIASLAFTAMLALQTSYGHDLLQFLPFVGSVDSGNIDYRQSLIEAAIPVIARSPLFGSADFMAAPELQGLRTGQQLIDVVNSYVEIALSFGLVGLSIFLAFFASITLRLRRSFRVKQAQSLEGSTYLRALFAILVGILISIGTVSSVSFTPYVYWSFAGLSVAACKIANRRRKQKVIDIGGARAMSVSGTTPLGQSRN